MMSPGDKFGSDYPAVPHEDPIILPDASKKLLSELCDEYKFEPGQDHRTCCNSSQVELLNSNYNKLNAVLWRCPACLTTVKRFFCDFTCNPNQAEFVRVLSMKEEPNLEKYIHNVTFYISQNYLTGIWESCKDNIFGANSVTQQFGNARNFIDFFYNEPSDPKVVPVFEEKKKEETSNDNQVVSVLNKISSSSSSPDGKLLLNSYGDGSGNIDKSIKHYQGTSVPCVETCSCVVCEAYCGKEVPVKPDYTCRIFSLKCWIFSTIIIASVSGVFLVAALIGIIQRVVTRIRKKNGIRIVISNGGGDDDDDIDGHEELNTSQYDGSSYQYGGTPDEWN